MNIVFCAAEMAPYAKVGGLADVIGTLPKALKTLGHTVSVCLPYYGAIDRDLYLAVSTGIRVSVEYGGKTYLVEVLEHTSPETGVTVYLFDNRELYANPGDVYPPGQFELEVTRFDAFCHAVLRFLEAIGEKPDILHVNDWHTTEIIELLNWEPYRSSGFFANVGTVLSLHNLAYQGATEDKNRLVNGIKQADALVAVSPTYAQEILTPEYGAGLDGLLKEHQGKLVGILNGIDNYAFDPVTDKFIRTNYWVDTLDRGKAACKADVLQEFDLPVEPSKPLFGLVSRAVEQKGIDVLIEALYLLGDVDAHFILLGSGDPVLEEAMRHVSHHLPNVKNYIGFNLALGQKVYAGADFFLIPSRFEPCGLSQMISFRYGTLPVARKTGGLVDTVFDVGADPINGNGFLFEELWPEQVADVIRRAMSFWKDQPEAFQQTQKRVMELDYSWDKSARQYVEVYERVLAHQPVSTGER